MMVGAGVIIVLLFCFNVGDSYNLFECIGNAARDEPHCKLSCFRNVKTNCGLMCITGFESCYHCVLWNLPTTPRSCLACPYTTFNATAFCLAPLHDGCCRKCLSGEDEMLSPDCDRCLVHPIHPRHLAETVLEAEGRNMNISVSCQDCIRFVPKAEEGNSRIQEGLERLTNLAAFNTTYRTCPTRTRRAPSRPSILRPNDPGVMANADIRNFDLTMNVIDGECGSTEGCHKLMAKLGLIGNTQNCPANPAMPHGALAMSLIQNTHINADSTFFWRCARCRTQEAASVTRSVRSGSILEGSTMPFKSFLKLLYMYTIHPEATYDDIAVRSGLSKNTIGEWYGRFRQICLDYVANVAVGILGGPRRTVEIDFVRLRVGTHLIGRQVLQSDGFVVSLVERWAMFGGFPAVHAAGVRLFGGGVWDNRNFAFLDTFNALPLRVHF